MASSSDLPEAISESRPRNDILDRRGRGLRQLLQFLVDARHLLAACVGIDPDPGQCPLDAGKLPHHAPRPVGHRRWRRKAQHGGRRSVRALGHQHLRLVERRGLPVYIRQLRAHLAERRHRPELGRQAHYGFDCAVHAQLRKDWPRTAQETHFDGVICMTLSGLKPNLKIRRSVARRQTCPAPGKKNR
jgi:hypothetical protein